MTTQTKLTRAVADIALNDLRAYSGHQHREMLLVISTATSGRELDAVRERFPSVRAETVEYLLDIVRGTK